MRSVSLCPWPRNLLMIHHWSTQFKLTNRLKEMDWNGNVISTPRSHFPLDEARHASRIILLRTILSLVCVICFEPAVVIIKSRDIFTVFRAERLRRGITWIIYYLYCKWIMKRLSTPHERRTRDELFMNLLLRLVVVIASACVTTIFPYAFSRLQSEILIDLQLDQLMISSNKNCVRFSHGWRKNDKANPTNDSDNIPIGVKSKDQVILITCGNYNNNQNTRGCLLSQSVRENV